MKDNYFVVEKNYEEHHSLVDKCLMFYLINLILLEVLGHNISDI